MHPADAGADPSIDLTGRRAVIVVHQPRRARHRQADRRVRQRDDRAVLRVPRRRDGRRHRQPARRRDPGRPACRSSRCCAARPTTGSSPTTCCGPRSPTRWPSPTSTWPTTTSCSSPAAGARRSTSGSPSRWPTRSPGPTRLGKVIGGICHGPLGLRNATGADGRPLVRGPADHRGHRQAGRASSASSRHRTTPRPSCGPRARVFESATRVPRPVRQPLGRRRQPRDRPEPERRADGRPGDDAAPARRCRRPDR